MSCEMRSPLKHSEGSATAVGGAGADSEDALERAVQNLADRTQFGQVRRVDGRDGQVRTGHRQERSRVVVDRLRHKGSESGERVPRVCEPRASRSSADATYPNFRLEHCAVQAREVSRLACFLLTESSVVHGSRSPSSSSFDSLSAGGGRRAYKASASTGRVVARSARVGTAAGQPIAPAILRASRA